eukprot:1013896-Pelagomonas_calceolata.AAC.1
MITPNQIKKPSLNHQRASKLACELHARSVKSAADLEGTRSSLWVTRKDVLEKLGHVSPGAFRCLQAPKLAPNEYKFFAEGARLSSEFIVNIDLSTSRASPILVAVQQT